MERNANDHRGSHLKESTDYHIDSVLSEAKQTSKLPINVNDVNLPTLTAPSWIGEDDEEEEEDADWNQLSLSYPSDSLKSKEPVSLIPEIRNEVNGLENLPRFKRYITAVEKDHWNADAWIAFLNELQRVPAEKARFYYERFFKYYPTAGHWWKIYAEHELREKQCDRVQGIIQTCLMEIRCPQVDLWNFYLSFTKLLKYDAVVSASDPTYTEKDENPADNETTDPALALNAAKQVMIEAFELAIERVGGSIYAAPIWQSYLSFLQNDTSVDSQAFVAVRKVFHRVLTIPMHHMETLWKEYEKFERSIPNNETLAQSFFKLFRPKFDATRGVFRYRKALYDAVNVNALAIPGYCKKKDGSLTQSAVASGSMANWKKIVDFERGNPERLDPLRLKSRVRFTFELLVSVKRHYPEAWYLYAAYENEMGDQEAATLVFERALEAIPESLYLQFACADHHELRGKVKASKLIYENLLRDYPSSLVYIVYQRFARRALGPKGLHEARIIFKRARKDERPGACTHHVYVASASLEFQGDPCGSGKEVALRIFELGLKRYIQVPAYVLCYLNLLGHLNEDNNIRSLFEKSLAVMPVEKSKVIWDRYVQFEHTMARNGGNLATVAKVEARRALALPDARYPSTKGLLSVTHRYSFMDLKSTSKNDQSFLEMYRVQLGTDVNTNSTEGAETEGAEYRIMQDAKAEPGSDALDADRSTNASFPEFLREFANLLPLHLPWNGPVADVEHIHRAMLLVDFPSRAQVETIARQEKQQGSIQQQEAKNSSGSTRSRGDHMDEDSNTSDIIRKRPVHDVFRARQQQKLAKLS